jgi:hypothetical protein
MDNIGLKRDNNEKYYTNIDIIELIGNYIKKYINIKNNDLIIEPSAGNGAFIELIKSYDCKHKFIDIEPENEVIDKTDFLQYNPNGNYDNIHIIGNPPFGRQSSLAIKFIKKAANYSNSISFILPKSFKKESMKSKFPLNYHLIFETDLPDNSFNINGKVHNVPCIFQIWEQRNYNREIVEKLEPKGFTFVKKEESPDISFRRVGVNAGKIDTNIDDKSIQSHYFIKFNNKKNKVKNIQIFKDLKFEFNNSVGPKSISKQELLLHVNHRLI